MGRCYDTCVDFANGLQLPVNARAPGNYTLPDGEILAFGVSAEYLNESRDDGSRAALIVIFILALLVSGTRLFVRATSKAPGFGSDDVILILAGLFYMAFFGMAMATIGLGEGRHIEWIVLQGMIDQNIVSKQEIYDFALHLIYNTALYTCRLSALAFFQRLSAGAKSIKIMVYAGYAIITALYLPQIFILIFHCKPVTALWLYDFQINSSKYTCMSWGLVYLVNGVLSVVSDLMLFTIPACLIAAFRADKAARFRLALVLLPGIVVTIVSIGRLGILGRGIHYSDQSWFYGPMLGLEGAELGGTMICISVPALKLFADRTLATRKSSSSQQPLRAPRHSDLTFTETKPSYTLSKSQMSEKQEPLDTES